ncbi:MAG TPA: hypothetical protein VF511_04675, partial [Chthoniobacterales bacterium]
MKTKSLLSLLALSLAVATLSFAGPDAWMGTWKLNEAKSKFAPGSGKNLTVVYSPKEKDMIEIMATGVDKNGKPTRSVWTGKFDERDYLVSLDD